MRRLPFFKLVIIGAMFSLVVACGYSFTSTGEHFRGRISSIYVEQFGNKTDQAEMENYFRQAFINQIIQNSRFKIAKDAQTADATIKGSVLSLTTSPLSYRANAMAAEERATITLELTFREGESGKIIWTSKNVGGIIDYGIDSNINFLPAARKTAFIKLANDTAEKAFNQMMSGF